MQKDVRALELYIILIIIFYFYYMFCCLILSYHLILCCITFNTTSYYIISFFVDATVFPRPIRPLLQDTKPNCRSTFHVFTVPVSSHKTFQYVQNT